MIYFDNAATGGVKPDNVIKGVRSSLFNCANPGRSGHSLSLSCLNNVLLCRTKLAEMFNAASFQRVIFTKNCTEALNIAILGCLSRGDHVVTTVFEHNSVLRPLHHLRKEVLVDYADPRGGAEAVLSLIKPETKAVIITLCSNVTGFAPDVETISRNLPENVFLICDGAQAAGHEKIDMQKLRIDALAVAGHKGMHAIQGSGALILSDRFTPCATMFGGTGSESFNPDMPLFLPDRLEAGTLGYPSIISLLEGVIYLEENLEKDREKLFSLTKYLIVGLEKISANKITLYSSPNPYGIVSFNVGDEQSDRIAGLLSESYDICVRGGFHCAPLAHRALSTHTRGIVRASLSSFNTKSECDQLIQAVEEISQNNI